MATPNPATALLMCWFPVNVPSYFTHLCFAHE